MRFKTTAGLACLLVAGLFGAGALSASASELGPIDNGNGTATGYWLLPNGGTPSNVTWPQPAVDPSQCGTGWIQKDIYRYDSDGAKAYVRGLWSDGLLSRAEGGYEDSPVYLSHTFIQQIPCATETETSSPSTPSTPVTTTPTAVPTTPVATTLPVTSPPVETSPPTSSPVVTPTTTPSVPNPTSTSTPQPTSTATSPSTGNPSPSLPTSTTTPTSCSSTPTSGPSSTTGTRAPTAGSTETSSPTPSCASVTSSTPSSTQNARLSGRDSSLAYTGSADYRPVFAGLFFVFLIAGTLMLAGRRKEFKA